MPEMYVTARWPDGSTPRYYSPSLVVREYLDAPASYPVAEFLERARSALHIASERVRAQYGFPCSRAAATLASIEAKASEFAHLPQAAVHVVALTDATATD